MNNQEDTVDRSMLHWHPGTMHDSRGVVLVLVLAVVSLFTVMVVNFSADQSLDIEFAYHFRDSLQAEYLARAGVEAAVALLAQDDPTYDAQDEDWASFSEYLLAASAYLEGLSFSGTLTDESSKIDINSIVKADGTRDEFRIQELKRLFYILEIDITQPELADLMDALVDWLDPDAETAFGAENPYYESLESPYVCKDGPMDSIEEILLVRGMKPGYFYGTDDREGIKAFITVDTKGMINLNTASDEVIFSIVPEGFNPDDVLNTILEFRPITPENLQSCMEAIGFSASADLAEVKWIKDKVLSIASARFSARIRGIMPSGAMVNIHAVLDRSKGKPEIVYYRIY
ncbi:MAG: type II secretion system minor pseudopilin GspK [Thermodesulfobacteriota bacterium]|nr:type II secretion system minor pseudopilin GspK [Thermodesulfobacteriota bacterium]